MVISTRLATFARFFSKSLNPVSNSESGFDERVAVFLERKVVF